MSMPKRTENTSVQFGCKKNFDRMQMLGNDVLKA